MGWTNLGILGAAPGGAPTTSGTTILAGVLMIAGVVMLGFIMLISVRRKIAQRRAATPPARERIERIQREAAARDDLVAVEARVLDSVQRLASRIDAKAARLERLLDLADQRLAALGDAAAALHDPTPAAPSVPPARDAADSDADPLTRAVYALADDGRDPVEIARELDEQVGKVELILALRA